MMVMSAVTVDEMAPCRARSSASRAGIDGLTERGAEDSGMHGAGVRMMHQHHRSWLDLRVEHLDGGCGCWSH